MTKTHFHHNAYNPFPLKHGMHKIRISQHLQLRGPIQPKKQSPIWPLATDIPSLLQGYNYLLKKMGCLTSKHVRYNSNYSTFPQQQCINQCDVCMKPACDCFIAALKERGFFIIVISQCETGQVGQMYVVLFIVIHVVFRYNSGTVERQKSATPLRSKTCLQAAE